MISLTSWIRKLRGKMTYPSHTVDESRGHDSFSQVRQQRFRGVTSLAQDHTEGKALGL